jgi:hypothetical protein
MKKPAAKLAAIAILGACALACANGCSRPLLSPEETRSPFDSYDSVRGQYSPQKMTDESGRDKLNLQQRLSTKD